MSGYAKPNIPCWYQMEPRNVLHSMVKAKDTDRGEERQRQEYNLLKKKTHTHRKDMAVAVWLLYTNMVLNTRSLAAESHSNI